MNAIEDRLISTVFIGMLNHTYGIAELFNEMLPVIYYKGGESTPESLADFAKALGDLQKTIKKIKDHILGGIK